MSLFDYYEPSSVQCCPVCSEQLSEWQGKDGACGIFVWRQGVSSPLGQRVDSETALNPEELQTVRLPENFTIYSYDCSCPYPVEANCSTEAGIWTTLDLVNAGNARQRKDEPKREFKRRLSWLQGGL